MPDYMQGLYSSLAQGVQVAQHLREAAQQHEQLQEEKRSHLVSEEIAGRHAAVAEAIAREQQQQREFSDALQVSNAGGQPVTNGSYAAPPVVGAAEGMPQLGGQIPVGGQDVTVKSGGQQYRLPTLDEKMRTQLAQQVALEGGKRQADLATFGVTLPAAYTSEFGLEPDAKVLPEHMKGFADLYDSLHPKPLKPEALHSPAPTTNDKGDVTTSFYEPGTGKLVNRDVQPAAGKTEAAMHPGATPKTVSRGQFAAVEKDKSIAIDKSKLNLDGDLVRIQRTFEKEAAAAVNNKPEQARLESERVKDVRQAYSDHYQRLQQAQLGYEARVSELSDKDVGHDPWADNAAEQWKQQGAAPATAPATAPAKAAPAKAAPAKAPAAAVQKVPVQKVKEYAAQFKITLAEAIKRFQGDGVKVGN